MRENFQVPNMALQSERFTAARCPMRANLPCAVEPIAVSTTGRAGVFNVLIHCQNFVPSGRVPTVFAPRQQNYSAVLSLASAGAPLA